MFLGHGECLTDGTWDADAEELTAVGYRLSAIGIVGAARDAIVFVTVPGVLLVSDLAVTIGPACAAVFADSCLSLKEE